MNLNMNKAFYLKAEDVNPQWYIIDAEGEVLGRLATKITNILRGKNSPKFTHHTDSGDYVVVINAEKVKLTGNKWNSKTYVRYSGYIGNKKEVTAKDLVKKHPTKIVNLAVKRMLPKNILSDQIFKKLKIYAGKDHPHKAQSPKLLK